ncbi:glycosyltransferase family 1 protein [Halobacillus sp. BBL2006]|uniref:glycosyltransferase family 1 protein n=1 Tax=Halobacillus sp. BBL2006 TaxID=1543706 RepID=UPI000543D997|nr:glycosyltransferase family 1 protein [Halobacillus sp. BBL2006]KHE69247.1 glycosyl transferase family 1 [Halobacillus sp. BBL2006]
MGGPLRVLHVVVNMNRGGAETLIMNLYRNIDRTKVQFDFLTCKEGVFDEEIKQLGGKIHRIPYISEVGHKQYIKGLDSFFQQHSHYKIVHSHMDKMSGFVLRAAKRQGLPVRIAHSHSTNSEGGIASKVYKWYAGTYINSSATHLNACSKSAAKWLFQKDSSKAIIIRNGIDSEKFSFNPLIRNQIRRSLKICDNTIVLGHVGRFSPPKNHMFLLEMFAEYAKINTNSALLLIGDGQLRHKIERKIEELNLEGRVKLLGVREDIHSLLQGIDIFIFPSLYEGLPVTLVEAQCAGLPCLISTNISNEVDINIGLIKNLPNRIEDKGVWVQCIMKQSVKPDKRLIKKDILDRKGFEIKEIARNTQQYYLGLGGIAS